MPTNSNPGVDRWVEATSAFDRVRSVAFSLQQPRTAGRIAEDAHVSEKTARNHLQRLVEMDVLLAQSDAGPTTYYPDPGFVRFREVRTLAHEHDRDELVEMVASLKADVEAWQAEFGVDGPDALRASTADAEVPEDAVHERRRIAEDWEYARHRLDLIRDALAQYDRLTARPPTPA